MWTADKEHRLEQLTDRFNETCNHWIKKGVEERTKALEDRLHHEVLFQQELLEAAFERGVADYVALGKVQELLLRGPKKHD